jgi:hypothetical protein
MGLAGGLGEGHGINPDKCKISRIKRVNVQNGGFKVGNGSEMKRKRAGVQWSGRRPVRAWDRIRED